MRTFIISLLLFSTFNLHASTLINKLKKHASPYLAMHGTDPVAWQEWNKESVNRAKKEGKLIYVSSGYFSCHWCHVMQQESYKNKQVAKILNTHFVPIKVDREIHSALDSHLIEFVERTQGRAGWPLNVFITPEGYPLVGMTYVPTNNFITILKNLDDKWKKDKEELKQIARSATEELSVVNKELNENFKTGSGVNYLNKFLLQAMDMADNMAGGFGEQNKFPSYPQLSVMLKAYKASPDDELKQFLVLTLNKMASQGLYDQLDGGFFRYVVDPVWQIPHFEKMLYDNALLASLYIEAAIIFNNKNYENIAKNTLDYLLNVFRSPQGAYIASLSAVDNKGVEGGYYLWPRDELVKILTKKEIQAAELIWQLEGAEDLEGGHHLVEAMSVNDAEQMLKTKKTKKYFNSAKQKMLTNRNKRKIPRDDKLLAAWNGLALSAFSKAAKYFNSRIYAKAAEDIKDYIYQILWVNKGLVRAVKKEKILGAGGLEDYAYVAQGVYDWLEYSNTKKDRFWLQELVHQAWKRFHSKKGWLLAEDMLLKYGQGAAVIADGVLPSPSAVLINLSLKVAEKNKDNVLKKKSLKALNVGHADLVSQPFWYASQIVTLFDYQNSINR
ncbi:MAG: DUF255 domain-containing protein [Gammaproteobacteria bacterium]|nr:DUF255 domain-containing protein [Gammaproteobacteria bacterium]